MSAPTETILIIEDDPAMLRGLRDNFEFEGYHVQTAADGDAGLKAALAIRPDLIILDMGMNDIWGQTTPAQFRRNRAGHCNLLRALPGRSGAQHHHQGRSPFGS